MKDNAAKSFQKFQTNVNVFEQAKYQSEIRQLNEVSSNSELNFDSQLQLGLEIATKYFGLKLGIISAIEAENYYIQYYSSEDPQINFEPGHLFELGKTYCSITIQQGKEVIITDMGKSDYSAHPCYSEFQLETYIGTPIHLKEGVYGTINFSSPESRPKGFDNEDVEFLVLVSRWVSAVLERRNQHDELIRHNVMLEAIYHESPYAFVLADPERKMVEINPAFEEIFGYSKEELVGHATQMIYAKPDDFKFKTQKRFHRGADKDSKAYKMEYKRKNSETFVGETVGYPIADNQGNTLGFVGIIRDMTEQIKLEESLEKEKMKAFQANKMLSMAEMASGVAHEINNPLEIINGYSEYIEEALKKENINRDDIVSASRKIQSTVHRIASIIKIMRNLSKDTNSEPLEAVSVGKVCNDIFDTFGSRFSDNNIDFQVNIEEVKGVQVLSHPVELSQILINLLNNSNEAVNKVKEKWIQLTAKLRDDQVLIVVSDSGEGLSKDQLHKVMEPFYTTKDVVKGAGLGLSIVKSLVDRHGGDMWFDDTAANTTFVIALNRYSET